MNRPDRTATVNHMKALPGVVVLLPVLCCSLLLAAAAHAAAPAQPVDSRFSPEQQSRELMAVWQETCLKHYRDPAALRAAALKANYLENPPEAASHLNGQKGTLWNASPHIYSQRVLILLDNGHCEIRAQQTEANSVQQAFAKSVESMARPRSGKTPAINVSKISGAELAGMPGGQQTTLYGLVQPDIGKAWIFSAATASQLTGSQAALAVTPGEAAAEKNAQPSAGAASAAEPGPVADPRFSPEQQARELIAMWQDTCLKHYRSALALRAAALRAGYLENPPSAASFLNGARGTVWDASRHVSSQRKLVMLDNGLCEIRAEKARASDVHQAFEQSVEALATAAGDGRTGITVRKITDSRLPEFGAYQQTSMYWVQHEEGGVIWHFGAGTSENASMATQAVLAVNPTKPRRAGNRVTLPAAP